MTPLDLDAIKARTDDARAVMISNDWEAAYDGEYHVRDRTNWDRVATDMVEETAEFLAHAIADVPALVAEVERLRAFKAEIQAMHPTARIHSGSSTHGGPEQYRMGCAFHGIPCRTWSLINSEERALATSDSSSTGGEL